MLPIARHLAALRSSGCLRVEDEGWTGRLWFEDGRVVAAEFGSETGLLAVESLILALPCLHFTFLDGAAAPGAAAGSDPDKGGASSLAAPPDLLPAIEMLTERYRPVRRWIPSLAVIPSVAGDGPEGRSLDWATVRTLLAVDGKRSVAEIAHERGLIEALTSLAALAELGIVRMDAAAPRASEEAAPPTIEEAASSAPAATTCPLLGFADDRTHHFSRPLQLHRCFAAGAVRRVSAQEQRHFCLTGEFAACPRFHGDAEAGRRVGTDPTETRREHMLRREDSLPVANDAALPNTTRAGARLFVWALVPVLAIGVAVLAVALSLAPEWRLDLSFQGEPESEPVARTGTGTATATVAAGSAPAAGAARAAPSAPEATPVRQDGLRTVLEEDFSRRQSGWPDDAQSTAWFDGGTYRLFARTPGEYVAVSAPIGGGVRDVVVEGAFRKVGGPPGGGYGLIVRDASERPQDGVAQGGRYLVFEVGDLGEIGVWRREDGRWIDLLPWTPSEAVRRGGEANRLRVRALGQRLTFFVNDTEVAAIDDGAPAQGRVGLFVGGDLNEVTVERFTVQVPR